MLCGCGLFSDAFAGGRIFAASFEGKSNGLACQTSAECGSTQCTDNVCCEVACTGQCESCATGTGACVATIGAPIGRPACSGGTGVCAATCDGVSRSTCTFPTGACGAQTCSGAAERQPMCLAGACGSPQLIRDCTTTVDTKRCGATACAGVVQVTAANARTFVEMSDGSIFGWGNNFKGVLGPAAPDGEIVFSPTRFPGLTGVKKLTSSPFLWHQCAIMDDGRLLCWGDNRYNQLGLGANDEVSHPTPSPPLLAAAGHPPLSGATDVSAGTYHSCAILAGDTVTCWGLGRPNGGQLADGDLTNHYVSYAGTLALPQGTLGTMIWSGEDHTCIATEGDASSPMKCWGWNGSGECGVAPSQHTGALAVSAAMNTLDATRARALALGNYTTCGVTSGGHALCFGNNQSYQLGRGEMAAWTDHLPQPVCATSTSNCDLAGTGQPLSGVTAISLGENHACALAGGVVKCWGDNRNGCVGSGVADYGNYVPYADRGPALTQAATQVTSGQYHSCALLADRTIACWGRNQLGELGVPYTTYDVPYPVYPVW